MPEDLFFEPMPLVLTASRIAQSPLDAAAPVSVIDRETIRASGFTEIHDLLRLVPGFMVADWPQAGPAVAHHAMASNSPHTLLVMLDGRSLVNPLTGSVDWLDLPVRLEDVERIEVVRSPNQASYGAMAFNGVINIITRTPGEDEGGVLSFSRGERDFHDAHVRLARRGERLDWRLSASDRSMTPFRDLAKPHYVRHETNSRQTLRAEATYRMGLNEDMDFDLALVRGEDELGSTLLSSEEPYHQRDTDSRFLQLSWRRGYAPDSEFSLRYFHYGQRKREDYPAFGVVRMNFDSDIRRDDLEFQQTHRFTDVFQGIWGAGVRRDEVESQHYFYDLGSISGVQWQVFGNLDWRFDPDWLLHVGAMLEKHYNTDTLLSPRLALNYTLGPRQSLRFSAGRGYRAPTLIESDSREVYLLGTGQPVFLGLWGLYPLRPERADFAEVGYVGRFDSLNLQVDARLYAERYSRLILARACYMDSQDSHDLEDSMPGVCPITPPDGYSPIFEPYKALPFKNTGAVKVRGAELGVDWQPAQLGRIRFSHALTHVSAGADTDDDIPDSAPRHSTSLLWSKAFPGKISASLGYYYVGYMKWLGDGDNQPPYRRLDLRLAKGWGQPHKDNEVALTIRAMNGKYFEFDTHGAGEDNYTERQAFVTLRLGW